MPLELKNVSYAYQAAGRASVSALSGVTLNIADGEFVGVMGHTGCGKTTLIQLMAGLLAPTGGQILLDGSDINARGYDRSDLRRKIGVVFQYPEYQLFETTVERDVAFGLAHSGLDAGEIKSRVRWALEAMGFSLEAVGEKSPLALSGGEKRRVAIAGVLASRPKLLIFDEPIAGLDPMGRESFLAFITRLHQEGTTIVMVSHNVDTLGEYAGRLVVMDGGAVAMDGSAREVFSDLDGLRALKLRPSAPKVIAEMLSGRGFSLPGSATSYGELLLGIKRHLSGGGAP